MSLLQDNLKNTWWVLRTGLISHYHCWIRLHEKWLRNAKWRFRILKGIPKSEVTVCNFQCWIILNTHGNSKCYKYENGSKHHTVCELVGTVSYTLRGWYHKRQAYGTAYLVHHVDKARCCSCVLTVNSFDTKICERTHCKSLSEAYKNHRQAYWQQIRTFISRFRKPYKPCQKHC